MRAELRKWADKEKIELFMQLHARKRDGPKRGANVIRMLWHIDQKIFNTNSLSCIPTGTLAKNF